MLNETFGRKRLVARVMLFIFFGILIFGIGGLPGVVIAIIAAILGTLVNLIWQPSNRIVPYVVIAIVLCIAVLAYVLYLNAGWFFVPTAD